MSSCLIELIYSWTIKSYLQRLEGVRIIIQLLLTNATILEEPDKTPIEHTMSISSFLSTWPLLRVNERGRYTPLGKESYQDGAQAAVAGPRTWSSLLTWRCVMDITPWMFTLFFAVSTLWLLFERNQKNPLGSFATGWATDFGRVSSKVVAGTLSEHWPIDSSHCSRCDWSATSTIYGQSVLSWQQNNLHPQSGPSPVRWRTKPTDWSALGDIDMG